jgi:hypothetical protein
VNVEIKGKKGKPSTFVTEDEEYKKVNYDKFTSLPTGQCSNQCCRFGSVGSVALGLPDPSYLCGFGSFQHQAKKFKKTLDFS